MGRFAEFQYYAFLIALGFLTSYIGYILVPARGPRFLLKHLQHIPLQGLWLFQGMQNTLDRLESALASMTQTGDERAKIMTRLDAIANGLRISTRSAQRCAPRSASTNRTFT